MDETYPGIVSAAEATGGVPVNRLGLALLVGLATAAGLAPVVLIFGRPEFLILAGGLAALIGFFAGKRTTAATYRPTLPEFLLSGVGGIGGPALLGLIWLVAYALLYGIVILVTSVARWLGLTLAWDAASVAYFITLLPAIALAAVFASVARDAMTGQLYPNAAGIRSPLFGLVTNRRGRLLVAIVVALAICATGIWLLWGLSRRTGFPFDLIFVQIYLFLASAVASSFEVTSSATMGDDATAVGKLLAAVGYKAIAQPRTGHIETDPLLINLDFLAYNRKHAFAVQIVNQRGSPNAKPVEWGVAACLRTSAAALDRFLRGSRRDLARVEPLLVLVDGAPSESLQQFVAEEPLRIVQIPFGSDYNRVRMNSVSDQSTPQELQVLARRYLNLPEDDSEQYPAASLPVRAPGGQL